MSDELSFNQLNYITDQMCRDSCRKICLKKINQKKTESQCLKLNILTYFHWGYYNCRNAFLMLIYNKGLFAQLLGQPDMVIKSLTFAFCLEISTQNDVYCISSASPDSCVWVSANGDYGQGHSYRYKHSLTFTLWFFVNLLPIKM